MTHPTKKRPEPIRVGDRFRGRTGVEWRVTEARPAGVRDLFEDARSRFHTTTCRQIRMSLASGDMVRLGGVS